MKIVTWVVFVLSIVGFYFSIPLIIEGSQPCSGDGCLIHISLFVGLILFIPSFIFFALILKQSFSKK